MGEYKLRDRRGNLSSTRFPSIHSYMGFIYRRDANPFRRLKVFFLRSSFRVRLQTKDVPNLHELSTLLPSNRGRRD